MMTTSLPRAVPREGLANPVFDHMGWNEDLIVSLSFSPGLTDQQIWKIHDWLRKLDEHSERGNPCAREDPFIHERSFFARVGNLEDPRDAVLSLIGELVASGAKIRDSFFACWERLDSGVMYPRHDPREPKQCSGSCDSEDYMDRLWNTDRIPPPSECEEDLVGGIMVMGELIPEYRGSRLYFPEVTIGYGLLPFVNDENRVGADSNAKSDACALADAEEISGWDRNLAGCHQRTDEVRCALIACLENGWDSLFRAPGREYVRPQPLDRRGRVDQIDRIRCGKRNGYLFSIDALELLVRPSPTRCRFREYELMEAVIATVAACDLAPVITWQRCGTPVAIPPFKRPETVEIQIWER